MDAAGAGIVVVAAILANMFESYLGAVLQVGLDTSYLHVYTYACSHNFCCNMFEGFWGAVLQVGLTSSYLHVHTQASSQLQQNELENLLFFACPAIASLTPMPSRTGSILCIFQAYYCHWFSHPDSRPQTAYYMWIRPANGSV